MKAYSLDLRQKIVDAYAEGNISQRQLALQFRVALSFIEKLLKQHRETRSIEPKVRTQQTPTKLNPEQLSVLVAIVEANNDATLEELRTLLHQQTGVLIGRSTVDRMLQKLNLTVKKNTTRHRKTERTSATTTSRVLAASSRHLGKRPALH
jgi:transposase